MLGCIWLTLIAVAAALWAFFRINELPRVGRWLSKITAFVAFNAALLALFETRSFPLLLLALSFHVLATLVECIFIRHRRLHP